MNLLETLTRAADEEQLRLHPLPTHAAASQKEHLRRHYALLLAAVLTAQPAVSEPQTRLLRMLLDALQLGDIRGQLFEQARDLTPEPLLEAARLIREAGFAQHLVLDALVLLRLDAPLAEDAARLVGELATFLSLNEADLVMRSADAANVLGLTVNQPNQTDGEESVDSASGTDIPPHRPPSMAEYWPSMISQPLTAEALRAGLQGGFWRLDANLDVDFPWQATNAVLHFTNGATLNTFARDGAIKLTDCRLFDVELDFQGACSITLERCDWKGNYNPIDERTALNFFGQYVKVTDSQFSTRNARTIFLGENSSLTLERCRFAYCGHKDMPAGVVYFYSKLSRHLENYSISNCHFYRCIGSEVGALKVYRLFGITNCEFISCKSLSYMRMRNIAISADEQSEAAIKNSIFKESSLYIYGLIYNSSGKRIAESTQFVDSNVYSAKFGGAHSFDSGAFIRGGVYEFSDENKNLMLKFGFL